MNNNQQFDSYINLLKDGLISLNLYRNNKQYDQSIDLGIFIHKYINTITPVLNNVISLTNQVDKNMIYNLISAVYNELMICLYHSSDPKNKETSFQFSILATRISTWDESRLDELRKYQGMCVKQISHQYAKYNKDLIKMLGEELNKKLNKNQKNEKKKGEESNEKDDSPKRGIILTMTSCKRFDLFEQTINSFLACCEDRDLIDEFFIVDDNSSEEDRKKMKELYPFVNFYFKDQKEKGHIKSMNIIRSYVLSKGYEYMFHLEDDWRFLFKDNFLTKCKTVLESDKTYGQCLLNKNYSEEEELHKYVGGIPKEIDLHNKLTGNSIKFYEHEYYKNQMEMYKKMSENPTRNTCYYWPSYSLRASLLRTNVLQDIGEYNEKADHFEMEYAHRYTEKKYKSVYLETLYCQHLGRKTWEINNKSISNAYSLNNEKQFVGLDRSLDSSLDHSLDQKIVEKREINTINLKKNNQLSKTNDQPLKTNDQPSKTNECVNPEQSFEDEFIQFIKNVINGKEITNSLTNKLINMIKNVVSDPKVVVLDPKSLSLSLENKVVENNNDQSNSNNPNNQQTNSNNISINKTNLIDIENCINLENKKVVNKMCKLKVNIINLERRKDRLNSFMEKNWDKIKMLTPNIFKAIDGNLLKPTNKMLKLFETSDFQGRKGMIGCACSHILLMLELIKSNEFDMMLILEDDVILPDNFIEKLKIVLEKSPYMNHTTNGNGENKNESGENEIKGETIGKPIWDIIFLNHCLYPKYKHEEKKGDPELELWDKQTIIEKSAGSTMGYLISKKGAETIIQNIQDNGVYNGIDWVIFKTSINRKIMESLDETKGKTYIYYCNPPILYPVNENMGNTLIDSDIQYDLNCLKLDLKTRLKREIIYWNIECKTTGYKSTEEMKIEGLTYNEKSNVFVSGGSKGSNENKIPLRTTLLTNICVLPFNSYEKKIELIKQIKEYPIVYYTIEDLKINVINDPEIDIPKLPTEGFLFSVPEPFLNDKVRNDISFECYLNNNFEQL